MLGGVDEAAGVDDQHFGGSDVGSAGHAVLVEHLCHAFGVDGVLRTAEADQIVFVFA